MVEAWTEDGRLRRDAYPLGHSRSNPDLVEWQRRQQEHLHHLWWTTVLSNRR